MGEVDDRSRKTHSCQRIFELSKGAQCHLGCNSIMFSRKKQNRMNPRSSIYLRALTEELCVDVGSVTGAIAIISFTAAQINESDP